MSSACTPHRLVGRRVRKKLASCFFVRRMRLDGKTKAYSSSKLPSNGGSIVFDFTGGEDRKASEEKRKENEEISIQNSPSHSNRVSGGGDADENYLVFCLGEDGDIDIVNDEQHDNIATADDDASQKGDEEERKDDGIEEMKSVEIEDQNLRKMEQFESCDSNLSDTSSGSFAFPVLKIEEWIGSPVHMPYSGNQSSCLHCCTF